MRPAEQATIHDARDEQFRLSRLQLKDWGTFSGVHDIAFAAEGHLIIGRSGTGKSTLLDALSALLVPPTWLAFNVAAREGERSRGDRSYASYIRGAWADQRDADSGEIATRHLRRGTTWSAIAATFSDALGQQVTLVQLFWLRGTGSTSRDVRCHYLIVRGPFELARALADFDLDLRALKRRLDDALHFDGFAAYAERFRLELGIASDAALRLLHRTQSAKNLGDLNTFLRDYMLDRPDTFEAADRLVGEFAELDAAHEAVVSARRQVETLLPAREADERREAVLAEVAATEAEIAAIDHWSAERRLALLGARHIELERRHGEEQRQRAQAEAHQQQAAEARLRLETEYRSQGGAAIEALESERSRLRAEQPKLAERRARAETDAEALQGSVDGAPAFEATRRSAEQTLDAVADVRERARAQRDHARDHKAEHEREFSAQRAEIEAMERQPSNIPAGMLALRDALAEQLRIDPAELPFVGELLQVRDDAQDWRAAAERLLRGFALALLVDDGHYAAFVDAVNDANLRQRLVYYRVSDARPVTRAPGANALCRKIDVRASSMGSWLRAELERRFDHACVETLMDFRRTSKAITRAGQVRHSATQHEKDDRHAIGDASRWVLGFDNREKLELFRERARTLAAQIAAADTALRDAEAEERALDDRMQAATRLVNLAYAEIDVAGALDREREIAEQLSALRAADGMLAELGRQLDTARSAHDAAERALRDSELAVERSRDALVQLEADSAALRERLDALAAPEAAVADALTAAFDDPGPPTLESLDARRTQIERGLNARLKALGNERSALERRMERCFHAFSTHWPLEAADMDATVDAAPAFLAVLERVEGDGLPRHEARFLELLRDQSTQNLAELNARIAQARKEIRERMGIVNEGLADADFNPGTHLQIEVSERHLPDVRDFRERVATVLDHAWQGEADDAEARFVVMNELVERLGGEDAAHRRWREEVLDVRRHVEFIGQERDAQGAIVEVYRSGAGKSGGQREKLATTCLAAALRYQLGGLDDALPRYAPVVLDEAFARADNEFTELVMRIFQRFGFQMIVATPLKSVMTLEPFIGGACFVDIADRKRSSTLSIEYDGDARRLALPDRDD